SQNLRKVFFTDAATGYIVGDSGAILKTTNAGGPTGISNNSLQEDIRIYPNPVSEHLVINFAGLSPSKGGLSLRIYDAVGKKVFEKTVAAREHVKIDLAVGAYLYQLQSSDNTTIKVGKLIVQR